MDLPAPSFSPSSSLSAKLGSFPSDLQRSRDLARIKIIATALLAFSVVVALVARLLESRHWSLGYVAAWAEAAAVGGLADELLEELCCFARHCDDEQMAARHHFEP